MPSQERRPMEDRCVLKGVLQHFMTYIHQQNNGEKSHSVIRVSNAPSINQRPVVPSESVNSYINYRKNVDNKLAEINNNISDMLIESFKGIDSICSKVRECVCDFTQQELRSISVKGSNMYLQSATNMDEYTTENLLESVHDDSTKSLDTFDEDLQSDADVKSSYSIESVERYDSDNEDIQKRTKVKSLLEPDLLTNVSEGKSKSFLPTFITVVGDGNTATNYEAPKETKKDKLQKRLLKRNKQKQLLKHLRESLKEEAINTDFQALEALIENVTEQIDMLSNQSMGDRPKEEREIMKTKTNKALKEKGISSHKKCPQSTQEETPLGPGSAIPKQKTFQIPEVYHRPAVTNIHKRLLWQLEANDSFVTFQRLMRKHKKDKSLISGSPISRINIPILSTTTSNCSQKTRKTVVKNFPSKGKEEDSVKGDLKCRYTDSLWFNEKKLLKAKQNKKHKIRTTTSKANAVTKLRTNKKSTTMFTNQKSTKPVQVCRCSVVVTNDGPVPHAVGHRQHMHHNHRITHTNRKLAYLDILDDLTNRDLLPINSEYPRKDNINKHQRDWNTDIHDCYLYKMMYGTKEKNNQIWNHLLQPTIECSDGGCTFCDHEKQKRDFREENNATPLSKEKFKTYKEDKHGLVVDKATIVNARKKVIQTLAPHIFDPQHQVPKKPFVVMPVRVFYDRDQNIRYSDNSNMNSPNEKNLSLQKMSSSEVPVIPLPLTPMKEVRMSRAKWTNSVISTVKKPTKKPCQDSPTSSLDRTSTNKPLSFSRYVAKAPEFKDYSKKQVEKNNFQKRDSKYSMLPSKNSLVVDVCKKSNKHMDKLDKPQKDVVDRPWKINSYRASVQSKGDDQQKTWNNKFEKSVGQQLVTFLKTQTDKMDKYESSMEKNFNFLPIKQYMQFQKIDAQSETSETSNSSISSTTTARHRQMLAHLKGLKHKNDQIQVNIQKAINVIECRMVDILSSPNNTASIDAFVEMEREITNVLDLMKFTTTHKKCPSKIIERQLTPVKEKPQEYEQTQVDKDSNDDNVVAVISSENEISEQPMETNKVDLKEEFDAISKDLFKKLENLLTTNKETSVSDFDEDSSKINGKRTNRNDKRTSSSDTTLSTDDLNSTCNKYHSTKPVKSYSTFGRHQRDNNLKDNNSTGKNASKGGFDRNNRLCDGESLRHHKKHVGQNSGNRNVSKKKMDRLKVEVEPVNDGELHFSDSYCPPANLDEKPTTAIPCKEIDEDVEAKKMDKIETLERVQRWNDTNPNVTVEITRPKSEECLKKEQEKQFELERPKTASDLPCHRTERRRSKRPHSRESQQSQEMTSDNKQHVDRSDACNLVSSESEQTHQIQQVDRLEDQMHRIISRVEDIYSQLDEIQISTKDDLTVPVFRESCTKIPSVPSREFLTPFMLAVKHSRSMAKQQDTSTLVTVERSPSYYNVLSFLDTLSDIQTDRVIELHTVRSVDYARLVGTANRVHFIATEYYARLDNVDAKELSDKPSCLKKYSDDIKPKSKKVSFVVMHQTESIQPERIKCFKRVDDVKNEERVTRDDPPASNSNVIVICDQKNTQNASTEAVTLSTDYFPLRMQKSTQMEATLTQSTDNGRTLCVDASVGDGDDVSCCDFSDTQSELSFMTAQSLPKIQVFFNESKKDSLNGNNYFDSFDTKYLWRANKNSDRVIKSTQKVVIFREINDIPDDSVRKKQVNNKKFTDSGILEKSRDALAIDNQTVYKENVVLLQSVYAIMYLLMFTALNLEYKCF